MMLYAQLTVLFILCAALVPRVRRWRRSARRPPNTPATPALIPLYGAESPELRRRQVARGLMEMTKIAYAQHTSSSMYPKKVLVHMLGILSEGTGIPPYAVNTVLRRGVTDPVDEVIDHEWLTLSTTAKRLQSLVVLSNPSNTPGSHYDDTKVLSEFIAPPVAMLGFQPEVRLADGKSESSEEIVISIGREVLSRVAVPDCMLAVGEPGALDDLAGKRIVGVLPDADGVWITSSECTRAEEMGCLILTPLQYLAHLCAEHARAHAPRLLGASQVRRLLEDLKTWRPDLDLDKAEPPVPADTVVGQLRAVLAKGHTIVNLPAIVKAIQAHGTTAQLCEAADSPLLSAPKRDDRWNSAASIMTYLVRTYGECDARTLLLRMPAEDRVSLLQAMMLAQNEQRRWRDRQWQHYLSTIDHRRIPDLFMRYVLEEPLELTSRDRLSVLLRLLDAATMTTVAEHMMARLSGPGLTDLFVDLQRTSHHGLLDDETAFDKQSDEARPCWWQADPPSFQEEVVMEYAATASRLGRRMDGSVPAGSAPTQASARRLLAHHAAFCVRVISQIWLERSVCDQFRAQAAAMPRRTAEQILTFWQRPAVASGRKLSGPQKAGVLLTQLAPDLLRRFSPWLKQVDTRVRDISAQDLDAVVAEFVSAAFAQRPEVNPRHDGPPPSLG